mmetsp:Transcript_121243/g.387406  ORF Transcript_121243/g.387406 Transcript_121243/m.387406 type:complete len:391 (+) Transcript_121243:1030-2202(+)
MSCFTFANGSSAILLARAVKSVLLSFTPFMRNKDSMAFLPASLAPRAAATTGATATRVRWRRAVASKEVFGSSACSTSASIADMALLSAATAFARRKLTPAWANRMVAPEVFSLTMVFTMVTACVSACSSSARILVRESYVVAFEAHMPESLVAYSLSSMRIAATVDRRWLALEMLVTAAILFFLAVSRVVSAVMTLVRLSCMNVSCSFAESTSFWSVLSLCARNWVSKFSSIEMTPSDLNFHSSMSASGDCCRNEERCGRELPTRPNASASAEALRRGAEEALSWAKLAGFEAFKTLMAPSKAARAPLRSAESVSKARRPLRRSSPAVCMSFSCRATSAIASWMVVSSSSRLATWDWISAVRVSCSSVPFVMDSSFSEEVSLQKQAKVL